MSKLLHPKIGSADPSGRAV